MSPWDRLLAFQHGLGIAVAVTPPAQAPVDAMVQLTSVPQARSATALDAVSLAPAETATAVDLDGNVVVVTVGDAQGRGLMLVEVPFPTVTAVEPPRALEFTDGFADAEGAPNPDLPTTAVRVRLAEHDGTTRMELRFTFESGEHMAMLERWGAFDVFSQSVAQMDAIVAGTA